MDSILWLFGLLGMFVFVVLIVKSLAGSDGDYIHGTHSPYEIPKPESEPEPKVGTYRIAPNAYKVGLWDVETYDYYGDYRRNMWRGTEYKRSSHDNYGYYSTKTFESFREAEAFVEILCEKKREAERLAEERRKWVLQNPPRIYDCSLPSNGAKNVTHSC